MVIRYIFGAYFMQFSLSFTDVNKNKGVAETAPYYEFEKIWYRKQYGKQNETLVMHVKRTGLRMNVLVFVQLLTDCVHFTDQR